MNVYAWLIDLIHCRKNCPPGMISGWVQKVTEHRGTNTVHTGIRLMFFASIPLDKIAWILVCILPGTLAFRTAAIISSMCRLGASRVLVTSKRTASTAKPTPSDCASSSVSFFRRCNMWTCWWHKPNVVKGQHEPSKMIQVFSWRPETEV